MYLNIDNLAFSVDKTTPRRDNLELLEEGPKKVNEILVNEFPIIDFFEIKVSIIDGKFVSVNDSEICISIEGADIINVGKLIKLPNGEEVLEVNIKHTNGKIGKIYFREDFSILKDTNGYIIVYFGRIKIKKNPKRNYAGVFIEYGTQGGSVPGLLNTDLKTILPPSVSRNPFERKKVYSDNYDL